MTETSAQSATRAILRRYAAGEISANQAAGLLGEPYNVADVIVMLHRAGLEPPSPPPQQARAELARARLVLGLTEQPG